MANSPTGLIDHRGYLRCALEEATGKRWEVQRTTSDGQMKAGRALLAKGDVEHGTFPAPAGGYARASGEEGGGVCAEGEV